jgi:hypothetical protein
MTDNEKAATFIGWSAKEKICCLSPCPVDTGWPDEHLSDEMIAHYRLVWSDPIYHARFHGHPAPHMTDPRNYMKALIAAATKGYYVKITPNPESDGIIWVKFYRGRPLPIEDGSPVKALAALYDAEHPQADVDFPKDHATESV